MDKKVVIAIIVIILIIVGFFIYQSISREDSGNFNFGNSEDVGNSIGESTDANSFDDVKLNPFENE